MPRFGRDPAWDDARRLTPAVRTILGFTLVYLVAALAAAWMGGSGEFLGYLVVMAVLVVVVAAVHLRVGLSTAALAGLSAWGLVHLAGGLLPVPASWPVEGEGHVLYGLRPAPWLPRFDQVVHTYGFGLVTWICWECLARILDRRGAPARPSAGLVALCVASGMGFGAANEVVEFLATRLLPETNVGGYDNTGWDLVSNLVGCLIAAALIVGLDRAGRGPSRRPDP